MAPKIIAAIVTLIANVIVGVVVFFMMLLGMNGFSEADANYGIVAYIVLAVLVSLAMAMLAAVGVGVLQKRNFGGVGAALLAVPVFSVVGGVLKVACSIVGVLVADFVRVNYR